MKDQTFRRTSKAIVWLALFIVLSFLVPVQYNPKGVEPFPCLSRETEMVSKRVRIGTSQDYVYVEGWYAAFTSLWSLWYWGHVELLPVMTDTYESAAAARAGISTKTIHWRWKVLGWSLLPVVLAGAYVYRSTLFRLHRLTK